jgi:hypothetical protein
MKNVISSSYAKKQEKLIIKIFNEIRERRWQNLVNVWTVKKK